MNRAAITAGQAIRDAGDFTRVAWRGAWAVQALFAAGAAMLFVAVRGRLASDVGWDLSAIGLAVMATTAAPLVAALLRLRLGGSAFRGLGPAGLQFGLAELRLLVIAAGWAAGTLLAVLPLIAISAFVFVVFRDAGMASLPMVGEVRVSFLVVAGVWLLGLAAYVYVAGRMLLTLPASVGKRRLVLSHAWALSRGQVGGLLGGLLLSLGPGVAAVFAAIQLDRLAVQDPDWGALSSWPLPDAILAGAVFGSLLSFIQIPLTLGVLAAVYCAQRQRRMERTRTVRVPTSLIRLALP